jgi:hypothetical protein
MEVHVREALMSISFSPAVTSNTDMVCHISSSGYLFWFYGMLIWILATSMLVSGARNILRYRIEEEVTIGTRVGDILQDSRLKQTYSNSPEILRQLRFGFLTESDLSFAIGAVTGVLETNGRIDRESITGCPRMDLCEITLDVAVQPVQYFQIIKITVEILDINDNAPMYPESAVTHPILESALQGSSFVIPTATDMDSPMFGVERYELDSEDGTFGITQKEKLDGAFDLRLTVQKSLDREVQDKYSVRITAYDGGNPPNAGYMNIVIPVMDSNDNSPVFDNDTYKVIIPESIAVGVSILRVRATDQDLGQNGRILYGFSPMTRGLYGDILAVNQETGDIFINGKLDREKTSVCNLIVTASDQGPDSLPSDTTVVVTITDVNDNAPQITINTLGSTKPDKAYISEDAATGTFVAHVSVTDPDLGRNGDLNCSLNDYTFDLQQTFETEYQIVTARSLDRETIPQYGLELVCRDKGQPPQVAIKRLAVEILDVNDNTPTFSQKSYTANMIENNFIGIGVIQTVATDRDTGKNGDISYSLSFDASETFEIDSHTGAIKTRTSIDRERTPQYHFQVIATDHGNPPRSTMAHMVVNVEDVNDEIPKFVSSVFTFYVGENEPERTRVGKVTAVDNDAPPHNQFMYTFDHKGSSSLPFSLDTQSGKITTRRPLDREKQDNYRLIVKVTDQGSPPMSSTVSITIWISDKNDNAPRFDFPNPKNNTVFISNKVPVGNPVTRISAHDPDQGNNATISFSFLPTSDQKGKFSLDKDSGVIALNVPLNDVDYATFELRLKAEDHGTNPQLKAISHLKIVVNSSIPYPPGKLGHTSSVFHYNVIVVVAVACGGAVITVSLIVGIILVRNQGRKRRVHKYNCRMEAKRMLSSKELQSAAPEESIPMKNGPQVGTNYTLQID